MSFEITKVDVWVGDIEDRPGALCAKLSTVMRAGANLDFIVARPSEADPSRGVLFMGPLFGERQTRAAEEAGLKKSNIPILRVQGPDAPGLAAGLTGTLAEAGLNVRGITVSVQCEQCLVYIRMDSLDDVVRAAQVLTEKLG